MSAFAPRLALALALVAMPAACGEDDPSSTTGTIRGTVLAGPTCPVEQLGQQCAPKPVAGRVDVLRGGATIVATTTIAADGTYTLEVPAGPVTVRVDVGGGPFPTCPDTGVTVIAGEVVVADVACDTGIR
jgi:hypothetical protein